MLAGHLDDDGRAVSAPESAQTDTLDCGCVLTYRTREGVALIFLTPCSREHSEIAQRVRASHEGRSSLVIKSVPSEVKS